MEHEKPSDLLQQLIQETAPTNEKINFDKIRALVLKTSNMRQEEQQRSRKVDQYFTELKRRIRESSNFLQKAKNDLENIDFTFQKERLRSEEEGMDYEKFKEKSDEEIEAEMSLIRDKLATLETRVKTLNNDTYGAEESFRKSIKTLQNISIGAYHEDSI